MSRLVEFFTATEPAVDSLGEEGPDGSLSVVRYGNFPVWDAIDDWEHHAVGVVADGIEELCEVVRTFGDTGMVLRFSDTLADHLAGLTPSAVSDLAEWWVATDSGVGIEPEFAAGMFTELRHLAQLRGPDDSIWCWTV